MPKSRQESEPTFGDELRTLGIGRRFVFVAQSAEVPRLADVWTEDEIQQVRQDVSEPGLLERAAEIAKRVSRESNLSE